jgi:transposase
MDGLQDLPDEVRQYIRKLEEENHFLKDTLLQLKQQVQQLQERVTYLERKLKAYENPHTPSSLQRFKNHTGGANPQGKRGAPPGHHGATRPQQEPDEIIPVTMDTCPRCGSYLGAATKIESRIIEDLPPPQKIKVTQYKIHHYHCPGCGTEIKATHPDCPHTGNFGVRLMTQITLMKYRQRCVLRRIQESLWDQHQFPITPKGIHDILLRVGDALIPEYQRQQYEVRYAPYRYTDETSSSVMGENHWLWLSRSDTNTVSLLIHPSRGRQALNQLLGEDITGVDVNDGWSSYHSLPETQRCWAHLLREVDAGTGLSDHEQQFSEEIHRRFDALKAFIGKDPPMTQCIRQKTRWDRELATLTDRYYEIPETRTKAQYLKNGLGSWHTCLLHPGMQPTNNLAEQAIREHVIQRKIIGCFRSERGAENYSHIASVLATWRLQGKNVSEKLENLLRQELCLSQS